MSLTTGAQEGLSRSCLALEAMALCSVTLGTPRCHCLLVVRLEFYGSSLVIFALEGWTEGGTFFLRSEVPWRLDRVPQVSFLTV